MSDLSLSLTNTHGMRLLTDGTYCDKDIVVRPVLEEKRVTENGTYTPSDGFAGIGSIVVDT